ncbi:MAG TPA: MFS transporter, partial [Clostridia bacterium]|nr:MFS transporter [Clostridia bacterium]
MSGIQRKTLWIFYTVSAMYWFSLYSYGSVLSNHASSLGADAVMIGTIAGSYGVAQLILRIPVGFLSDRVQNRKYFIGAGILFCLVSGIGLGLSPTPEYMLVFRIMAGIGATSSIILPGYMTETFREMDSHHAMGNMSASFKLGRTFAIIIGGLIAQFVGSKWAFLAGGIAAGICLIPWIFLPLDRTHEEKVHHSTREILSVIKDRDLYMSSTIMIFFQFAVFATTYTFTPVMARDMGVSNAMEVRSKKKLSKNDLYNSQGAGDQGMVFGYACDETKELMPLLISLAHKLCLQMAKLRRNGKMGYLRPDGKSQVTIVYEKGKPVAVDTVILSSQHSPDVSLKQIQEDMGKLVLDKVIPKKLVT